jgi:hypothetical protein
MMAETPEPTREQLRSFYQLARRAVLLFFLSLL